MSEPLEKKILDKLDHEDRAKVSYFVKLLMSQSKYRRLKEEVLERRQEIERGEVLTHKEIWDEIDV